MIRKMFVSAVFCALLLAAGSAVAAQGLPAGIRTAQQYAAGQSVAVNYQVTYSGDTTALGISEQVPADWTFVSVGGPDAPDVSRYDASTDTLELSWYNPPVSPADFSYALAVPAGQSGIQTIRGEVLSREGDGPENVSAPPDTRVSSQTSEVVSATRTAGPYTPGANYTVQVQIGYTQALSSLSMTDVLPVGWSYQSVGGANPPAGINQSGTELQMLWFTTPGTGPISFNYTVAVPPGESGTKLLSGQVFFTVGAGDLTQGTLANSQVPQEGVTEVPTDTVLVTSTPTPAPPTNTPVLATSTPAPVPVIVNPQFSSDIAGWIGGGYQPPDNPGIVGPGPWFYATSGLGIVAPRSAPGMSKIEKSCHVSSTIHSSIFQTLGGGTRDIRAGQAYRVTVYGQCVTTAASSLLQLRWVDGIQSWNEPTPPGVVLDTLPSAGSSSAWTALTGVIVPSGGTFQIGLTWIGATEPLTWSIVVAAADDWSLEITDPPTGVPTNTPADTLTPTPPVNTPTDTPTTNPQASASRRLNCYNDGESFTVTVQINYAQALSSLSMTETLPPGWTYQSVGGTNPPAGAVQSGDELQMLWFTIPGTGPIVFAYTVAVPLGNSGAKTLSGEIWYTIGPGDLTQGTLQDSIVEDCGSVPTDTDTPTVTNTSTVTNTPTDTRTATSTRTPSYTPTVTNTATVTDTGTATNTSTVTNTPTSTPPCSSFPFGDINEDCVVDSQDLMILMQDWKQGAVSD